MHQNGDDRRYAYTDSWWRPRFLDPGIDKEFRLHFDAAALSNARIVLVILIFFWCGFVWFDLHLSPAAKMRVLEFRFAIVTPLLLLVAVLSFLKVTASFYQPLIVFAEFLAFASLIRVVALYEDFGFLAHQLGFDLSMPDQDAKFIFVTIWIIVVFIASLAARIRTPAALALSGILILAMLAAVYVFKPSALLVAIAGPFIFACIPAVFAGSLMMQRLALHNFRVSGLLEEKSHELENTLELLKTMFGRYLSTEVMASLIENPSALELGGEKRRVTIMMTDLRGFTAVAERLKPEQVVQMLNSYFEVMVEVVLKYQGTINEIIGDALLIIFGAPQEMPDRAQRAIACAIEMQNAMAEVNEQNRAQGLPELEMGIGLNETEVIVGNIGSSKRSKYTVVGSGVNMTSRIESYSVGGQVLISDSVLEKAADVLRIDNQREVFPKGAATPLKIYEVGGIAGQYNITLEGKDTPLVTLIRQIPVKYTVLEGKTVGRADLEGSVLRLSHKSAEISIDEPAKILSNLKMNLIDVDEKLAARDFYGKVLEHPGQNGQIHLIRFTSVPSAVDAYFQSHRQHADKLTKAVID
ncbi:MAG: adenylate/guanylate cyclase domain-containing protein [Deltaproteobacteria bacterium]|jgi:adenylate cyclase|nr:adenylate/guanylate cyclase domain-containing protein [Deltaproteobacteria bacterium]